MEDQLSWVEEITEILNEVTDGDLSSSEATSKIQDLAKKGDSFMERKKILNEKATPEELKSLATKYDKRSSDSLRDFMKSMDKLSKSGRMTQELTDALQKMEDL